MFVILKTRHESSATANWLSQNLISEGLLLITEKRPVALDDGFRGEKMANKKPIKKFQAGQVCASIWENEVTIDGRNVTMLKTSIERRYKDRDGNWQSSNSLSQNEIPKAVLVLNKAFEWINEKKGTRPEGESGE